MRTTRCSATAITAACIFLTFVVRSFPATIESSSTAIDSATHTDSVIVGHYEFLRLPFRTIEEVLGLQSGTTVLYQKQIEDISLPTPRISVRGGLPTETGYYLNGVAMNDPYNGYFTTRVSPLALERMTLDQAELGAQHGFAGPSAVRMVTRRGGSRYSGTLEAITDKTIGSDFDQNWYTATLGGPFPGLSKGRFFGLLERRYFGDRNPSLKTDDFLPGSPKRLPGNWLDGWAYNGRLDYDLRSNISLTATLDGSVTEWSEYIHSFYFDSLHLPYYKDEGLALSGLLKHQLNPALDYSVQVSYTKSGRFRGDGRLRENLAAYRKPYVNWQSDVYQLFYAWDDMEGVTEGYDESHTWDDYLRYKSTQLNVRWDVTREIGWDNRLTLGADCRRYAIRAYQNLGPTEPSGFWVENVNNYGYDMVGKEVDGGGTDWGNEVKHPREYDVHLTGQLRFGDLELNPGLRLDIFDYNALTFKDIHRPFGDNDVLDREDLEKTPTHVRWSPRIAFRYAPADYRFSLDGGYGLFYSPVPYSMIYSGWDFEEARIGSGSFYPIANPDIQPLKIRSLQLGVATSIGDFLRLKITGFDNETRNAVTLGHVSPVIPYTYIQYTGDGEQRSCGLETRVELTLQDHLTFGVRYTIQSVESNTPSYQSVYDMARINPDGLAARRWYASDLDQPNAFSATLRIHNSENEGPTIAGSHPLERMTLDLTEESATGLPYTPMMPYDEVGLGFESSMPVGRVNSASSPNTVMVNLMLQRDFSLGSVTITPFLWVKNLFDAEVVYHVYSGTGQPDNTGLLDTDYGKYVVAHDPGPFDNSGMRYLEKYELAQRDPVNYGPPRQVFLGLRVTF